LRLRRAVGQDGILRPIGNRPVLVFMPYDGAQRYADRRSFWGGLATGSLCLVPVGRSAPLRRRKAECHSALRATHGN
jgi:hypothetical protein